MNANIITTKVGMADLKVDHHSAVLRTSGLGSCVGLTLYDPLSNIGGMAHIMLPSSEIVHGQHPINNAKYADTAIPELLRQMKRLGAIQARLQAKMAGGAQMFAFVSNQEGMRIGPRNVDSCKLILASLHIPLLAEDTGGNYGRTIDLQCHTGMMIVRSVNKGVKEL